MAGLPIYENYYDIRTHACVTRQAALSNTDDDRQNRLSDAGLLYYLSTKDNNPIVVDISLERELPATELTALIDDLPSYSVLLLGVDSLLQNTTSYTGLEVARQPATIRQALADLPNTAEQVYADRVHPGGYSATFPKDIRNAINAGSFLVGSLILRARPGDVLQMWTSHTDLIRRVGPQTDAASGGG